MSHVTRQCKRTNVTNSSAAKRRKRTAEEESLLSEDESLLSENETVIDEPQTTCVYYTSLKELYANDTH